MCCSECLCEFFTFGFLVRVVLSAVLGLYAYSVCKTVSSFKEGIVVNLGISA